MGDRRVENNLAHAPSKNCNCSHGAPGLPEQVLTRERRIPKLIMHADSFAVILKSYRLSNPFLAVPYFLCFLRSPHRAGTNVEVVQFGRMGVTLHTFRSTAFDHNTRAIYRR
jgi:hypothetical protein